MQHHYQQQLLQLPRHQTQLQPQLRLQLLPQLPQNQDQLSV
jgi:hypothetical protein